MIKYTVNVSFDVVDDVKVAHIEMPELNVKWTEDVVTPYSTRTYEKSDLLDLLKCVIAKKIKRRESIPLPASEEGNVVLDWQTELRVRLSNFFIEKYKEDLYSIEDIVEDYSKSSDDGLRNGSLTDSDIREIFTVWEELDIIKVVKLMDVFCIKVKINELRLELS